MDDVQLFLAMNVDSGGNPVLCPFHPDVGRGRDGGVYGVWLCVPDHSSPDGGDSTYSEVQGEAGVLPRRLR